MKALSILLLLVRITKIALEFVVMYNFNISRANKMLLDEDVLLRSKNNEDY